MHLQRRMLLHITRREPAHDDAFTLLLACHGRISAFTALAQRLGEEGAGPAAQLAEGGAAVARYFQIGLPLHVEDEERSLAPRLLRADLGPDARRALVQMSEEHVRLDAALEEAAPLWRAIAESPQRQPALRRELARVGTILAEGFAAHLQAEEGVLFPAARSALSADDLLALAAEIKGRRAP